MFCWWMELLLALWPNYKPYNVIVLIVYNFPRNFSLIFQIFQFFESCEPCMLYHLKQKPCFSLFIIPLDIRLAPNNE